ncbi:FAD-dependent oxidoreductase [Actinoplanes sp. HUAS TT8]|uniref:FAD-dependent oxidoreductase n=1 Tax=Actinoplanes sp. HUAS TT8 TaxID=3447453 RepID=UPI003F524A4E
MRVVVIGAGIGGLTLAQALRGAGIDVVVHERDARAEATAGYQLHLDDTACAILRRHLPPASFQALLASSPSHAAHRWFFFADHRMRVLAKKEIPLDQEMLLVGRVGLRVLLARGLDDAIRWGSEYVRHETHPDGTVTAHFADGTEDHGDLLVAADGSTSRVTAALAGRPTSAPIGIGGIAGRTPLTPAIRERLPDVLAGGSVLGVGPGGIGTFLTLFDVEAGAALDPGLGADSPAVTESSAVYWGVNVPLDRLPDARKSGPDAAVHAAVALLKGWSPVMRDVVAAADRATVGTFRYHACDPGAHLTPWASGVVTGLGDAVHAMPPTGGRAAATAIRDADLLAEHLAGAVKGRTTIPVAVHEYERGLTAYAGEAVRVSMQPIVWQRRLAHPALSLLTRLATPLAAALHR